MLHPLYKHSGWELCWGIFITPEMRFWKAHVGGKGASQGTYMHRTEADLRVNLLANHSYSNLKATHPRKSGPPAHGNMSR